MRWQNVLLLVCSLVLVAFAHAYGQDSDFLYLPSVKGRVVIEPAPDFVVLEETTSWYYDPQGSLIIVGLVKNNSTVDAFDIAMDTDLFDSGGNLLDSGDGIVADSVVQPGETSCFRITINTPPSTEDVANLRSTFDYGVRTLPTYNLLVFDVHYSYDAAQGFFNISGQVRNVGPEIRYAAYMSATVYSGPNHTGYVVRCGRPSGTVSPVRPGDDAPFSVTFAVREADIGSVLLKAKN